MRPRRVLVIGAGVSGLTTAVCLAEAGLAVRVRAAGRGALITSCAAGAIWSPYLTSDERAVAWSEHSRQRLVELAEVPGSGVRLLCGLEASGRGAAAPDWARALPGFRTGRPAEIPPPFRTGWWYCAPVVDMPVYLGYLADRLRGAGVPIESGTVHSLEDAVAEYSIVVNCTGIGAARLVPDDEVRPARGQLVVVENPGLDEFFIEHEDSEESTYYLPQGDRVVLGGSAETGRVDLRPDPAISERIRARCAALQPALATAVKIEDRVGLRPIRQRVRLEAVPVGHGYVLHNYGHGGSGVTMSWGCAQQVVELLRDC
jgi:D-amino-acid oxidase